MFAFCFVCRRIKAKCEQQKRWIRRFSLSLSLCVVDNNSQGTNMTGLFALPGYLWRTWERGIWGGVGTNSTMTELVPTGWSAARGSYDNLTSCDVSQVAGIGTMDRNKSISLSVSSPDRRGMPSQLRSKALCRKKEAEALPDCKGRWICAGIL